MTSHHARATRHIIALAFIALICCYASAANAIERAARPLSVASTSSVAGISFSEPARQLPIDTRFSQSIQTVAFDLNLACAQIEAFGWSMAPTEQARVDALFTNTALALNKAGYRVQPQNPASVAEDITVYTATQSATPKEHKLFVWSAGDAGLLLLVCDAKGELLQEAELTMPNSSNSTLGTAAGFGAYESGPADINPQDLLGIWEGSYNCRSQGKTGGRLAISRVQAAGADNDHRVEGTLSFFPIAGNDNVERGSYRISGTFNSVTQQAYFEPGKWLQQPRGYVAKPIIAYFDAMGGKVSAIFQDTTGCTSFEARQKPNSAAEARSIGAPAKKKPKPKRKPQPKLEPKPEPAAEAAPAISSDDTSQQPKAIEPAPAASDSLLPLTPAELATTDATTPTAAAPTAAPAATTGNTTGGTVEIPATAPVTVPAEKPVTTASPEVAAPTSAPAPNAATPPAVTQPVAPTSATPPVTTPAAPVAPAPAAAPTATPTAAEPIVVPNKVEPAADSAQDALARARAELEAAERARANISGTKPAAPGAGLAIPAPAEPKPENLGR